MSIKPCDFQSLLNDIREIRSLVQTETTVEKKQSMLFKKMKVIRKQKLEVISLETLNLLRNTALSHAFACNIVKAWISEVKKKSKSETSDVENLKKEPKIFFKSMITRIHEMEGPQKDQEAEEIKNRLSLSSSHLDHLQRRTKSHFVNCDILLEMLNICIKKLMNK